MVEPTPAARSGEKRLWQVVEVVGRVLIATGVLLLLFVAYQLWGTGLQYSRSQDSLRSEFDRTAATATATTPASASTTSAPLTTTTSVPPPEVFEGDVLARLEMPSLGTTSYVVAGVSVTELRRGPGHFPETPLPGQLGNAAIAGHRTTYGAPFARIDELKPGDEIVITTRTGQRYVYGVSGLPFVVPAAGVDVLADTPGRATLTLVSCHPKYTARNRIIVQAALVPEVSAPPSGRTAPYAAEPENPAGETPATTSPGEATVTPPTVLTGGWFADGAAWPGVILWGIACGLVSLAAWWIGRRTRRWVGILAMVIPFVMFLYLFFENVNRLLPANL